MVAMQSTARGPGTRDLDQGLSCGEQRRHAFPCGSNVAPQLTVLAVPTGNPEDARRSAQPIQEMHEVHVFGYEQIDRFPRPLKDLEIGSVRKTQIEEMDCIGSHLLA